MDAETQEIRQARHRASVKWLVSKAFNNRVPDNLKEPFYRDHENQERLKPQIVVELGNATLYCQTLSNLYSDPNYESLNHWSILQTLARKGVPAAESPDTTLTETVLRQTNPLRINAHMAVIESLMVLYAKEIISGDRVLNAILRMSGSNYQAPAGQPFEQPLLAWVSHACAALKKRVSKEIETGATDENGVRLQTPNIPPVREFQDLCDGICLALLISYYCPMSLPWTRVRINYLPAVEDSVHNILLISDFSQKHLPYNVFHLSPEDITYMRGSMKLNLIVLLSDLFNLFEIHPAKCVCYPEMDQGAAAKCKLGANEHGIVHRRGLTMPPVTPIPDLRSELDFPSGSPTHRLPLQVMRPVSIANKFSAPPPAEYEKFETNNFNTSHNEGFVVHKSRGITTLSSMHSQQEQQHEPLFPARLRQSKEKSAIDSRDEKAEYAPAGRPSTSEQSRRCSFAGRRSRRNSSSEDSQLTIENFGGSQDQLNNIGHFDRDRERERDRERKLSSASAEPAVAVRSSIADARGTLQLGYDTDSGSEKQDRETEKYSTQQEGSVSNTSRSAATTQRQHSMVRNSNDNFHKTDVYEYDAAPVRKFSQGGLPAQNIRWQSNQNDPYEEEAKSLENASKLTNIRMKLEEKRRRIEEDKLKIELALSRHQEKKDSSYGIEQGGGNGDSGDNKSDLLEGNQVVDAIETASVASGSSSIGDKPISLLQLQQQQDAIKSELQKWDNLSHDSKGIDSADMEKYQQSIAIMNMNLQDIQQDIQRLATQQNQIQAQHLQAQQLMQAQQIANMLNQQQTYGSQQHLAEHPQQRQSFGSTPHLPKAFNMNANVYNSRPPSRDPYLNMQQPQPHPIQYINEHGQYMQQQSPMLQPAHNMPLQNMYCDNAGSYNNFAYGASQYGPPTQQFISRYDDYAQPQLVRDPNSPQPNQFYMNESSPQPPPAQRRTWTPSPYEQRQQQQPMVDVNAWQSAKKALLPGESYAWEMQPSLHTNARQSQNYSMHQNGNSDLFQVHSSPQHVQYNNDVGVQQPMPNLRDNRSNSAMNKLPSGVSPLAVDDIMAPQSICFIGDEEDVEEIERDIIESMQGTHVSGYSAFQQPARNNLSARSNPENYDNNEPLSNKLNITSGNLTYRIPSPSRPLLHAKSFQDPREENPNEKGFYISFDDEQPKRSKPPLRPKRSPKKEKSFDITDRSDHQIVAKGEMLSQMHDNVMDFQNYRNSSNDNGGINNTENKSATYNKHTDPPIQLRQLASCQAESASSNNRISPSQYDRRHLEDVTNQQQQQPLQPLSPTHTHQLNSVTNRQNNIHNNDAKSKALVIGTDVTSLDRESVDEMERRKEKIMLLSLQRRQQQEEAKARKEIEASQKREREREKEEERARKKEEQMARRAAILEQHRLKKAQEEAEREGKSFDRAELNNKQPSQNSSATLRLRQQRVTRPRPKTIHVDDGSMEISEASSVSSRSKKGSSTNLTGYGQLSSNSIRRDFYRGSQDSLNVKESPDEYPSTSSTPIGRRGSYKTSRAPAVERGRTLSRISVAKGSTLNFRGRKSNSLMNLCDTDSGLGRATPPRRAPSPGMAALGRNMSSASGPGSLPPGLISKRRGFDDGSSDISTPNSMMEYSGPKLYKQPAAKSNRGIILNAVEYCVFPGAVNREAKQKVLEKIARSEAKHFLILFRDAGCQFRALYSYMPETDQVCKLYGTGPSQVDEIMFDKFFKYNSGGKCFSQVHTKHLTVTIDAFTIHNSLWQGKKVHLPSKKDMALVI